jgi:hypothetical protein
MFEDSAAIENSTDPIVLSGKGGSDIIFPERS